MPRYDSARDTIKHSHQVFQLIKIFITQLKKSAANHDMSKLFPPEKNLFDEFSPRLNELDYGSVEYQEALECLKPALDHHYANNSHHPEHNENSVSGMTLMDIVEMFCDWKAATLRHDSGNLMTSLAINKNRFGMSDELTQIFVNTATALKWK